MKRIAIVLFVVCALDALVAWRRAAADDLGAIIRARAGAVLPADLAVGEVHLARTLAALDVSPDQVDVEWPAAPRPGRASVRVRLRTGHARTVYVPVTLSAVVEVAVATRDLAPGQRVTAADFQVVRRPAGTDIPFRPDSAVGQQVTAAIKAGEVLDGDRLAAPAPIARGTEVTVRVRKGGLAITTRGTLEAAARPGERARVRIPATHAVIEGVLADATTVTVGGGS